ncbi:hypothetical protein SAMN04488128_104344 [Chitinophaga eiseniae]|uniref:Uncharacterized protein n=1 Tax=Chitinophaga eiseniae TaxID=634771 RepID=A0A1T4TBP5_9BACT|nr:hypothetical protein [Chitinophaga eiseniae]SKA37817.1 hypothetical protein SAMN04488128_104344 [Chitinophaga eiseniae]
MKQLLLTTLMGLFSLTALAQQKTNLAKLQFDELAAKVLQGITGVRQGKLYDLPNMLSYGIDNKGVLLFDRYAPPHVELLAYNEKVAGFGFRIMSYSFQQEIKDYLENHYALKLADSSRWGKQYTYADSQVTINFQAVPETDFKQGRSGYLDIKTSTLTKAIAVQEEKYKKAHR